MVTEQEYLSAQVRTMQRMQYLLSLASAAAASHRLISDINAQMAALDQLESRYRILSVQRGWDLPEMEPYDKWLTSLRFRCRKDDRIAEYLIRRYTDDTIALLKLHNRWTLDDPSIKNLFQKYMDSHTVAIRQLQVFL